MSNAVSIYEKKVFPLATEADALKISGPKDMTKATDILSRLNQNLDAVEAEEDKIVAPAKLVVKTEQARWKPFKDALKPAIESLRKRMGAYQQEQEEIAAAEEAKIAARTGPGKGKLNPETAIRKMSEVEKPETNVSTESGSVAFRTDRKFEVLEISKLPFEFLLPNEVAIRKALKDGLELPGVRYYNEKVPINKR